MTIYPSHRTNSDLESHPVADRRPPASKFTRSENKEQGKALRQKCPRESHATWKPSRNRLDTVELVKKAEKERMKDLLPLRHGRMAASPFTFYRGAAMNMAADLHHTPDSGIILQCCGDAHLLNFGGFATPERRSIFSINDLDETNPAPWEWDLKRLAASFVIAGRNNGLKESDCESLARDCSGAYRKHMADFSEMTMMELWYHSLEGKDLIAGLKDPAIRERAEKRLMKEKARSKGFVEDLFPKLTEYPGHKMIIKDQLPGIFHMKGTSPGDITQVLQEAFMEYRDTLSPAYQVLLDHFQIKDIAIKVVGIGSIGTLCWVMLLMDNDNNPFFLQVKEARASVLEEFAGKSKFENHGRRVVNGYKLMQPYSDIFLGWSRGRLQNKDYYIRQLRDMKIKVNVESFGKAELDIYADWCGQALALSHARSGDSARIAGYMGKGDVFDKAIGKFSMAYADQNEKDFAKFKRAIRTGELEAEYDS